MGGQQTGSQDWIVMGFRLAPSTLLHKCLSCGTTLTVCQRGGGGVLPHLPRLGGVCGVDLWCSRLLSEAAAAGSRAGDDDGDRINGDGTADTDGDTDTDTSLLRRD